MLRRADVVGITEISQWMGHSERKPWLGSVVVGVVMDWVERRMKVVGASAAWSSPRCETRLTVSHSCLARVCVLRVDRANAYSPTFENVEQPGMRQMRRCSQLDLFENRGYKADVSM